MFFDEIFFDQIATHMLGNDLSLFFGLIGENSLNLNRHSTTEVERIRFYDSLIGYFLFVYI